MVSAVPVFEDAQRRVAAPPGVPNAVSWPAVFAGAIAAAALSLILLVLGTGLGLSVVSPWAERGASAEAISWSTIAWISFMALASSGLGGYIAGRLRGRWPSVHQDEVYFRDTAHGFLAWAVATLLTAATLTSAIGTVLGTTAKAGAEVAAGGAQSASQAALPVVDSLLRGAPGGAPTETPATTPAADVSGAVNRDEVARILEDGMRNDTRLQQAEAEARSLADQARKAGARTALWIFVSLLLGAFTASLTATIGGRQRDMF